MANYLIKDAAGTVEGPINGSELRSRINAGRVNAETLIQQEGRKSWHRARDIPGIRALLEARTAQTGGAGEQAVPEERAAESINYQFEDTQSSEPNDGPGDAIGLAPQSEPEPAPRRPRPLPSGAPGVSARASDRDPASGKRVSNAGFVDRILRGTFQFARSVSVLVIATSMLAVIGAVGLAAYALLPAAPALELPTPPPTIEQFVAECRPAETPSRPRGESRPRSAVMALEAPDGCAAYRDQFAEAAGKLRLDVASATRVLCLTSESLESGYRDDFAEGFGTLAAGFEASKPTSESCDGAAAANWYIAKFKERIAREKADESRREREFVQRRSLLGPAIQGAVVAIAALLLFLILPLLIQIERNTRDLPTGA